MKSKIYLLETKEIKNENFKFRRKAELAKFIRKIYLFFFLSNIKSYRDKVLKRYDLLDDNTKTEPRGSKIS